MVLKLSAFCIAAFFSINVAYGEESPSRDVVINGKALSLQELQNYDKLFCDTIPDGRYWLKEDTLEWGGEGLPSRGYFYARCSFSNVMVNGQRLTIPLLRYLERVNCGPIADGHYWLDYRTGVWGYENNPSPQGRISDACNNPKRRPSLSERGMWHDDSEGGYILENCPSPPCHD